MTATGRLNDLLDHLQGTPDAAAVAILWSSLCADRSKTREQVDLAATWLADQISG